MNDNAGISCLVCQGLSGLDSRNCGSGSDIDISTSFDEEIYGGHYSVELPDKFYNGVEQKRTGFIGDKVGQCSWLVIKVTFSLC